jgi:CelD/BcsL family acetyltransferase involved in cellulose biosynthesis
MNDAAIGWPPFADPAWIESWLAAFAADERTVRIKSDQGESLTLCFRNIRLHGIGLKALCSPTNDHTPRYEWPVSLLDRETVVRLLSESRKSHRWDLIELYLVPLGSATAEVLGSLSSRGYRGEINRWFRSARVDLTIDKEEYFRSRSKKLRATTNNAENKLRRLGDLQFLDAAQGDDWRHWLGEALMIEAGGWKGREGSAISQRSNERNFYEHVLADARSQGNLRLFLLFLNGELLAFNILVFADGTYYGLKTGYRDDMQKYSPGNVLFRMVLDTVFGEARARTLDMLDPVTSWKERWATDTGELALIRVYAPGIRSTSVFLFRRVARRLIAFRDSLRRSAARVEPSR